MESTARMNRIASLSICFVVAAASLIGCQTRHGPEALWMEFDRVEAPETFPPHPRLFMNQQEIDELKEWIDSDPALREYVDEFVESMLTQAEEPELPSENRGRNAHLARQACKFALAYVLSDEPKLAEAAAAILKGYVDVFPGYPISGFKGKATDSTLGEASWAAWSCAAYDLIYNSGALTEADKAAIEQQVFKESAKVMQTCNHAYRSNWRIGATTGVGVVGFTIGDRELIDAALNGSRDETGMLFHDGFVNQMAWSQLADGIYYERSSSYTSFCMYFYYLLLDAARHSGVDLWHMEFAGLDYDAGVDPDRLTAQPGPKRFRAYFDALCYRTFGNIDLAKVGNDGSGRLHRSPYWAAAWRAYGDPKYAWLYNMGLDKPVGDPLELMFVPPGMPAGEFDLSADARIGLNGVHTNTCTLLPSGGFAILRQSADEDAAAAAITFGEFANAHSHADQLSIVVYSDGRMIAPELKDHSYGDIGHTQWSKHTISHNTVTVDEVSQYPQGESEDAWAGDTKEWPAFGRLVFFHPGQDLRAVRAETDSVYEGVVLDRTVALVDSVVVDFFRCRSDEAHQYDYALHVDAELAMSSSLFSLPPAPGPLSDRVGYNHLIDLRRARTAGAASLVYRGDADNQRLQLELLGAGPAELISAKGHPNRGGHRTSALIVRKRGTDVDFVSVMVPAGVDSPIEARRLDDTPEGILGVELTRPDGTKQVVLSSETPRAFTYAGVAISGQLALLEITAEGTRLVDQAD